MNPRDKSPSSYKERTYRNRLSSPGKGVSFNVAVKETDLWVCAERDLSRETRESVLRCRHSIEEYIRVYPEFLSSFSPLRLDPLAPPVVQDMLEAAAAAKVGPMASVAGAIAQHVSEGLLRYTKEVIVENGGDIYMMCRREVRVGVFAGESPLSFKVALKVGPADMPVGICTSSATVGPSVSLGRADAVCVLSASAALADAAATAIGNMVKRDTDIQGALERGMEIPGVRGALVIVGKKIGLIGAIELY
ncbi:MAG: UPF0280 family protein [Syntrophobacterales bacterium]|nr:UPF0280 family protein [Syntrophobacterales bacterium]